MPPDSEPSRRARSLYPGLRRLARRLGYHLVVADYYSPIPDEWSAGQWENPAPMPGVDLRLDDSLELLVELAPHIREYAPPGGPPGTKHRYHHGNGMYPQVDAEVLYAIVRHLKPTRIVEVGAGWSSRVIADALDRNTAEVGPIQDHRIFDPFPPAAMPATGAVVEPLRAEEIPAGSFTDLGAGDVLFIDTTHTVKHGNDVVLLILEVLPRLAPGVVVHIHDILLPYCYPEFLFENGLFWQEQYLLQAFLAFNPRFEVLLANYALLRERTKQVDAILPGFSSHVLGSALWLRSTG